MNRAEFIQMKLDNFPEDVIKQYGLHKKVNAKGFVILRVEKGMYRLPRTGSIAQDLLTKRLNNVGYRQSDTTLGFWKYNTRPICLTLLVDDFGVKYVGNGHAQHLVDVLQKFYVVNKDCHGKKYCGINLDWDYDRQEVHLSMAGYFSEALARFHH